MLALLAMGMGPAEAREATRGLSITEQGRWQGLGGPPPLSLGREEKTQRGGWLHSKLTKSGFELLPLGDSDFSSPQVDFELLKGSRRSASKLLHVPCWQVLVRAY